MNFNVGDVLLWKNFPYRNDESSEIKDRLFVYLGKTGYGNDPVYFFVVTTTTQLEHYGEGGSRTSHCFFKLSAGKGNLDENSIIDFDYGFYDTLTDSTFAKYSEDISIIGSLDTESKRSLYHKLIQSKKISKMILKDVHSSYNLSGITNLKRP